MMTQQAQDNIVGQIISYEEGVLNTQEVVSLFSELIKSGMVYCLQGSYGREAQALIDEGIINAEGVINQERLDEVIENGL